MKRRIGLIIKECVVCGREFPAKRSDAKCCDAICRSRLSRGSIGRIGEWQDLLRDEPRYKGK